MIYQLNGSIGPFTLEANDNNHVIALLYKISNTHSIYTSNPILIDQKLDMTEFSIKVNELFNHNYNQYVDENVDSLLEVANSYLAGYNIDRVKFNDDVKEISNSYTVEEEAEKNSVIKMLKDSYQSNDDLDTRMSQVINILKYRKKLLEKDVAGNITE